MTLMTQIGLVVVSFLVNVLILVVLHEESIASGSTTDGASGIFTDSSSTVSLGSLDELCLSRLDVLSTPRLQD